MEITPESTIEEKLLYLKTQMDTAEAGMRTPWAHTQWQRDEIRRLLNSPVETAEVAIDMGEGRFSPRLIVQPSYTELGVPVGFDIARHIIWILNTGLKVGIIHIGSYWARLDDEMVNEIISAALRGGRILMNYKSKYDSPGRERVVL